MNRQVVNVVVLAAGAVAIALSVALGGGQSAEGSNLLNAACCLTDGSCIFTSQAACKGLGGTYFPGLGCGEVDCSPLGACCLPDGSCLESIPFDECENVLGGVAQGTGTPCSATACQPFGACCTEFGTCQIMDAQDCVGPFRAYLGDGSTCDASSCPLGSCCFFNDTCLSGLTEPECLSQTGVWNGPDSTCDDLDGDGVANACQPCPEDVTGDGSVNVLDLIAVLLRFGDDCP